MRLGTRLAAAGGALALTAAALPAPVAAQAWIGLMVGDMIARGQQAAAEHACMMGTPLPASETDETRAPAASAMAGYWRTVAPGGPRDVAGVFEGDRDGVWSDGATSFKRARKVVVTDRFAVPGAALDTAPQWLQRTGDGVHVRALWLVRGGAGEPLGGYTVTYRRNLGRWHLRRIELVDAGALPPAPALYCHKEGDVAPYQLAFAESEKKRLEREAEKARKKAEKARLAAERRGG